MGQGYGSPTRAWDKAMHGQVVYGKGMRQGYVASVWRKVMGKWYVASLWGKGMGRGNGKRAADKGIGQGHDTKAWEEDIGEGHGARECGKGMGLYETRVWGKTLICQGHGACGSACHEGMWQGHGVRAWDTCLGKGHGVGICGKGKG